MTGEAEEYVAARSALLDALTALQPHLDALVLVGAQAIYVRVGDADIAVPGSTTDGDLTASRPRRPSLASRVRSSIATVW